MDQTGRYVAAALDGDDAARGGLLERLRPRIVLWASARMGPQLASHLEAEDVAQEILLAVHKSLPSFRGEAGRPFFAWLFTLAENRIRDLAAHYGAKKRRLPEAASFSQTSPSTAAARNEMAERLRAALGGLAEDHRRVLQLRRFEGMEVAEVAESMGRTPNAVRILYCRAVRALKTALE